MSQTKLTEMESVAIVNALKVAAEQYRKDAATLAAEFGDNGRSVTTFVRQAQTAEALAEKIDGYVLRLCL